MDTLNKSNGFEKIDELYRKLGYFQRYGGTIIFVIFISIIVIETFIFFQIINHEREIKKDWVKQRCKPYIVPLAGFINKPDNKTILEFTGENFTFCIQEVTKTIAGNVLFPFNNMTNMLAMITSVITEGIQAIRSMINKLRKFMSQITQSTMDRIANVVIPLQVFIMTFRDFTAKTNAIIIDAFYLLGSIYYTLMALANTLNDSFFQDIDVPGVNLCFDENTVLELEMGKELTISDIQVGDTLKDGSVVTAKLRLKNPYDKMYSFEYKKGQADTCLKIIVSEKHRVLYNGELIYVKDHPEATLVENYDKPYLYCINTSTKRILINGYLFADWDDLTDEEINSIIGLNEQDTLSIHNKYDGGFHPDTILDVFVGGERVQKRISEIDIGDIIDLDSQNKVYSVVEVLVDKNDRLYEYVFPIKTKSEKIDQENDKDDLQTFVKIKGGNHMILRNERKTDNLLRFICKKEKGKLYHLLTTNKVFKIHGVEFKDYNSCIENI